jgi:hypothetical protein
MSRLIAWYFLEEFIKIGRLGSSMLEYLLLDSNAELKKNGKQIKQKINLIETI